MSRSSSKSIPVSNVGDAKRFELINDQNECHGILKPVVTHRWFNWSVVTYWGPSNVHHHQRTIEVWHFQTPGLLYWNGKIVPVDVGDAVYIWPGIIHAVKPDKWPVVTFDRFSIPDYNKNDDVRDEPGYDW